VGRKFVGEGLNSGARDTSFGVVQDFDARCPVRALLRLFRFLLRLQGLIVEQVVLRAEENAIEIHVRRRRHTKPRCPRCGRIMGGEAKPRPRRWRHLDLMQSRSYVVADVREARCKRHGRMVERVPWASWQALHTKVFDRHVASLAQVADKTATARTFDIAWRTVGAIIERVVAMFLPEDLLDGLVAVAVDEVSYKRGHRYLTVVVDLMSGLVVWAGEGKSAETFEQFFDALGPKRCAQLEVVAMDMSGAYLKAVKHRAPHAEIIYDRFHVVKLLLEAIDQIRREECAKLTGEARSALKHTRFALLRNPRFARPGDRERIEQVRQSNARLARAYELRVDFEQFWEQPNEHRARDYAMRWTRAALKCRLEPLRRFARTVRQHLDGILGFFRHCGQTSGVLEGTNNKIKLLIHRAFGFHRVAALIAMIHLCCSGIRLT
jgi:transposase